MSTLTGLARRLVEVGLLSPEVAEAAFDQSLKAGQSFVTYLLENKLVSNCRYLALAIAEEFSVPVVDINAIDLNPETLKRIDEKLIRKHQVLPIFERGNRLFIAISDPTNQSALDEIQVHTKMDTEAVVVEEDKLAKVVERVLEERLFKERMLEVGGDLDIVLVYEDAEAKAGADDKSEAEEAPIIKFVNKMFYDAIKMGASALHFEPYEKFYRVRFRINGILRVVSTPPVELSRRLVAARLKVMSRLDVSERRVPQDGLIKLKLSPNSKVIDFRVSTMPTLYGETIVLRILDLSAPNFDMNVLGYEPEQQQLYLEALRNPHGGMILVTGPRGGKTISLYTGINILNQEGVAISTVEDPIETNFPGVNQVQVDEKMGLTFARALREFLCQDPDIILVGEMRDFETSRLAIEAAARGHLVMSALHTNDAPQTLTRLVDMGIPPFAIADAVKLIIAQRLCRRLCTCKIEHKDIIPDAFLLREGFKTEDLERRAKGKWKLYTNKPNGCGRCDREGFKGLIGIYQVMPISKAMRRLIMAGSSTIAFANQAALEGIADLRKSGLKKVMDGFTSLEEINRVVNKDKEKDE
jgi:type IV pilus assembly protein PilB